MKRIILTFIFILAIATASYADLNHGLPTLGEEMAARAHDHFSGHITSGCLPGVPSSSLTIDAFACEAYVSDGNKLFYVTQPSLNMVLPDSATVCIGIAISEIGAAPGSWSRESSKRTHYVYQAAACSAIAAADGVLEISEVTVAGSVITAVKNFAYRSPTDAAMKRHSITNWGAVADSGTTDNTTAIQAAADALINRGDTLYIPCVEGESYEITDTITLPTTRGIIIESCGVLGSAIIQATASKDVFDFQNTSTQNNVTFRNLWLDGSSGTARYGILWGTTSAGINRSFIQNVRFSGFATAGLGIQNSILVSVTDCIFNGNKDGILEVSAAVSAPNAWNLTGSFFESQTEHAVRLSSARGWNITGNTAESNALGGFRLDIAQGFFIGGNYFEANYTSAGGGSYFDIFLGITSQAYGTVLKGNVYGGLASYTDDYVPVRIKFSDGVEVGPDSVANGSRYLNFESGGAISRFRAEPIGFVNGDFALSGVDASFLNIPSTFYDIARNNHIEQVSHIYNELRQDLVRYGAVPLNIDNLTDGSSSGTIARDGSGVLLDTTATASRTAIAYTSAGVTTGIPRNEMDYSKAQWWTFVIEVLNGTTNGEAWIVVGVGTAAADPAAAGFGFKLDNLALKGLTHTGSALTEVDLSTTITTNDIYVLEIFKSSSVIQWYVNGVLVGTSANVATSTAAVANVLFAAANNADSAQQRFAVMDAHYRVTQ